MRSNFPSNYLCVFVSIALCPFLKIFTYPSTGANPNVPGGDSNTVPLHEASIAGCISICQSLIQKGASKTEIDAFGNIPADVAMNDETKKAIEETECDITDTEQLETTVLLNASTVPERFVIFSGLLDKDQVNWLKKSSSSKKLHFSTTMKLSEDVTHVVVNLNPDTHSCPESPNYFNSILMGKWIVGFDWIKQSINNDVFADEETFVAKGNTGCVTGIRFLKSPEVKMRLQKGINPKL